MFSLYLSLSLSLSLFFLLLLRTVESLKIIRDCARSEETLFATEDMIESVSFEEPSGLCDRETRRFTERQAEIVSTKVDFRLFAKRRLDAIPFRIRRQRSSL